MLNEEINDDINTKKGVGVINQTANFIILAGVALRIISKKKAEKGSCPIEAKKFPVTNGKTHGIFSLRGVHPGYVAASVSRLQVIFSKRLFFFSFDFLPPLDSIEEKRTPFSLNKRNYFHRIVD